MTITMPDDKGRKLAYLIQCHRSLSNLQASVLIISTRDRNSDRDAVQKQVTDMQYMLWELEKQIDNILEEHNMFPGSQRDPEEQILTKKSKKEKPFNRFEHIDVV